MTALTREDSKSELPEGVKVARVNYDNEETLVPALKGQQFLVITLAAMGPQDTHAKIVKAAAKAGIPYIMPNNYGSDLENKKLAEEFLIGKASLERCADIKNTGVCSYVSMVCSFWYEWSLALGEPFYGIDIKNRKATFFDDGTTRINTSTWEQCGQALAKFLSLKELPEDESDKSPTISQWKNKSLYISSFLASQRDMLDSVHRVIGTTDKDWEITHVSSAERYKNGLIAMKAGDRMGFVNALYTRVFFPNGDGDYESRRGLDNDLIGLKKETKDDMDAATKRAVEMVESGWNPFTQ